MLDVTYEAVDDLPPGRLADIGEERGRVLVRLDRTAPLAEVVRELNIELDGLLRSSHWFQLWEDEIVSRDTPGRPLSVRYLLERRIPFASYMEERKGLVSVYVDPALDTAGFAASVNPALRSFLDGGCWFQLYAGEIIDNSPESNKV
ncbi:hypothetical protein [Streptomyces sp. ISBFB 2968]|uniref:hypothetical protein n=1 Tax=Streptomyces sp. ISBFB 2968 TaxID=2903527 RepID=UPI002FDB9D2F